MKENKKFFPKFKYVVVLAGILLVSMLTFFLPESFARTWTDNNGTVYTTVPRDCLASDAQGNNKGLYAVYSDGTIMPAEGSIDHGPHASGGSAPCYYQDQLGLWAGKWDIWGIFDETLTGYVYAPVTGTYKFMLSADDQAWLTFNGAPLITTPYNAHAIATIDLVGGTWYPIQIKYQNRSGSNWFSFWWHLPDKTVEIVEGGFEDDFSVPALDSAWETWPGWNNSYGSYTITNGVLQYILSPWQHDAAYYDTPNQSGGYTYYPGLLLARKFSGDKWTFETKINYNMPWSNGRALSTQIWIGNDGVRPSMGSSGETFGIVIYRNADQAGYGAGVDYLYVWYWPSGQQIKLPLNTSYFRVIRDGYNFTLMYSSDGINYNTAFSVTAPSSIDGKAQKVVIGGNSWATPVGSYAAYDYIKVVVHQKYSTKEVFLISDKVWQNVLSLVSLTTWMGTKNVTASTQPFIVSDVSNMNSTDASGNSGYIYAHSIPMSGPIVIYSPGLGQLWTDNTYTDGVERTGVLAIGHDTNHIIQPEQTVTVETDKGKVNVYLPKIIPGWSSGSVAALFYVAQDGSTYHSRSDHDYNYDTNGGEHFPDLTPEQAMVPEHLARVAPPQSHKYPTLIYHEEDPGFDADSIIYFLQQYSPTHLTIFGETPQELDNLLIATPPVGAGLKETQIKKITMNDYFSYWPDREVFVVTEDNYELGLMASVFASYINAPLLFEDHFDYDVIKNKKVYIIGDLKNQQAIEDIADVLQKYSLTDLQKRYIELTNTDKIILVNPKDLNIKLIKHFNPEKSGPINELFGKNSLAAPFLAAAKRELILVTDKTDYKEIDSFIESEINSLGVEPNYLTVIAAPNAIPYREQMPDLYGWENYRALDQTQYGDFNADGKPDLGIGRLQGITLSDVSSYIARDLFYDSFAKNDNMKFMASSFLYMIDQATKWSAAFRDVGYNAGNVTNSQSCYSFNPSEWDNQHLISYQDHGSSSWAGISSSDIPLLDNSIVFNDACSTCSTYDQYSFCNRAIRQGALVHMGAVCVAWTGNTIYMNAMNRIYYDNLTIGQAFSSSYIYNSYYYMTTLFGDPTLELNPQYRLNKPLQ